GRLALAAGGAGLRSLVGSGPGLRAAARRAASLHAAGTTEHARACPGRGPGGAGGADRAGVVASEDAFGGAQGVHLPEPGAAAVGRAAGGCRVAAGGGAAGGGGGA